MRLICPERHYWLKRALISSHTSPHGILCASGLHHYNNDTRFSFVFLYKIILVAIMFSYPIANFGMICSTKYTSAWLSAATLVYLPNSNFLRRRLITDIHVSFYCPVYFRERWMIYIYLSMNATTLKTITFALILSYRGIPSACIITTPFLRRHHVF